jgi:hypothetical protein
LSPFRRAQAAAIAALGYPLINLLGHTLGWRVEGLEHVERIVASGRQPVMAFWHGRILPATFYFRGRGIVVMTSENFDGEWIARIIARFGYGTARGSTSRGGRRALRQLVGEMRRGRATGFAIDGPRGPAGVAQPGAIWLAGAAGQPLLPFHLEASRYWELGSWDRTQIPRPFSTVALVIGEPMTVVGGLTESERDLIRLDLETRLSALERRALALVGR